LWPRVEHEKSAAACAHQLSANGSRFASSFVVLVDDGVGHFGSELSLVRPMLVQELAGGVDVAGDEDAIDLVARLVDAVHALDGALVEAANALALLGEHDAGRAFDA